MFSALKRLAATPSAAAPENARRDVAQSAATCKGVFFAARQLVLQGAFGPPLDRLLARASELIDDIDDVLVALDPVRDAPTFAVAASLQRELERLQAAVSEHRRRNGFVSKDRAVRGPRRYAQESSNR